MSTKERQSLEGRLSNYAIPLQILQMVAENCQCYAISAETRIKGYGRNGKISSLLSLLDDRSILSLQQIFLECNDSFSNFRLATFMSSKLHSTQYKFVMNGAVKGASGHVYTFDVCVYSRDTEELVALGMQNNNVEQKPSENEALLTFLHAVTDLHAKHARLSSACYASSYGYVNKRPLQMIKQAQTRGVCGDIDIKLLEYQNTVYFENKS